MTADGPVLAVVGATGAVGTVVLELLSQRADVWGEIRLVASARSAGTKLVVRGEKVTVVELAEGAFDGVDVAVFDVPDEVSARWVPVAAAKGVVCIDNSGAFRMDDDVPLVVPEVNPHDIANRPRGIIANPNCTTLTMVVAIGALHRAFGLRSLVVSSYQAASGAGQPGIDRLRAELAAVAKKKVGVVAGDIAQVMPAGESPFPAPLALNVIPWAGSIKDDGWTSEELKVRNESRKILGIPGLPVSATCVRVPVLTVHSLAVHATFDTEITQDSVRAVLGAAPGVVVWDRLHENSFPHPAATVGTDATYVGRIRVSMDDPKTLEAFMTGDNLRKGAALNTVQIAEQVALELAAL